MTAALAESAPVIISIGRHASLGACQECGGIVLYEPRAIEAHQRKCWGRVVPTGSQGDDDDPAS